MSTMFFMYPCKWHRTGECVPGRKTKHIQWVYGTDIACPGCIANGMMPGSEQAAILSGLFQDGIHFPPGEPIYIPAYAQSDNDAHRLNEYGAFPQNHLAPPYQYLCPGQRPRTPSNLGFTGGYQTPEHRDDGPTPVPPGPPGPLVPATPEQRPERGRVMKPKHHRVTKRVASGPSKNMTNRKKDHPVDAEDL